MQKQTYSAKNVGEHNTALISTMGIEYTEGHTFNRGRDWLRQQICRHDTFSLVVTESYCSSVDIGYTRQEDYIKVSFWLGGKHTTVLDGYGQHEHDRPEVFITSGPLDMIKVDVVHQESQVAVVALCLRRDFFPTQLGLSVDELPEPLRGMLKPVERPYSFWRFPLTADLASAARAILAAPFQLRRNSVYGQAKCVELMCLLVHLLTTPDGKREAHCVLSARHEARLQKARRLLNERYAEPITLEDLSKEVGLNRMALTAGFRQLFSMSVYDCLQKERMERAYQLLQEEEATVTKVAEAVGFNHQCNFSTAFRRHFGCTPQNVRRARR